MICRWDSRISDPTRREVRAERQLLRIGAAGGGHRSGPLPAVEGDADVIAVAARRARADDGSPAHRFAWRMPSVPAVKPRVYASRADSFPLDVCVLAPGWRPPCPFVVISAVVGVR